MSINKNVSRNTSISVLYFSWNKPSEILELLKEEYPTLNITTIYNVIRYNKQSFNELGHLCEDIPEYDKDFGSCQPEVENKEVTAEEQLNKTERQKIKLTDNNNLLKRQLRAINRKDTYYERFIEKVEEITLNWLTPPKLNINFKPVEEKVTCILLSDTHSDEYITKTETADNEEYNFKVFQQRLKEYEQKLIRKQLIDKSKYCSLFLLGDIVSWMIHEELYENWEAWKMEYLYRTALVLSKFILNISQFFKEVHIQTKPWNHWRMNKDYKYKRTDENWDNLIYILIKGLVQSEKKINFNMSTTFLDTVNIEGFRITYAHWDEINKDKMITNNKADLYLIGHYHQANYDAISKVITNWAFNKWNWWVSKKLTLKTEQQHQVSFLLEKTNWKYELWDIRFNEIIWGSESNETYDEILQENMLLWWNDKYIQNEFEIVFGTKR